MKYFLLPHLQELYTPEEPNSSGPLLRQRQKTLMIDSKLEIVKEQCTADGDATGMPLVAVVISHSMSSYLYKIKNEIDDYKHEWEEFKKLTNPYEFIHTPVTKDRPASSVSIYRPLSRSFFKMIEILTFFRCSVLDTTESVRTFHLAEGPGGFIQAVVFLRNGRQDDVYVGMTLVSDNSSSQHQHQNNNNNNNIPKWKKSKEFLQCHRNVKIEYGSDKTGNLLSIANFEECYAKYKCSMNLVTGDGGFDFTEEFNRQEANICHLLFAQMCYAVVCQKKRGSFILKVFDIFHQATIDIIAILSSMYEHVFITKPNTSRYVNSEKYIVCLGFIPEQHEVVDVIYPAFRTELRRIVHCVDAVRICEPSSTSATCINGAGGGGVCTTRTSLVIQKFLTCSLPQIFLSKIVEANAIIGQQQIERIFFTLVLIKNKGKKKNDDKINGLVKKNTQKCIEWCVAHNLPYNND